MILWPPEASRSQDAASRLNLPPTPWNYPPPPSPSPSCAYSNLTTILVWMFTSFTWKENPSIMCVLYRISSELFCFQKSYLQNAHTHTHTHSTITLAKWTPWSRYLGQILGLSQQILAVMKLLRVNHEAEERLRGNVGQWSAGTDEYVCVCVCTCFKICVFVLKDSASRVFYNISYFTVNNNETIINDVYFH